MILIVILFNFCFFFCFWRRQDRTAKLEWHHTWAFRIERWPSSPTINDIFFVFGMWWFMRADCSISGDDLLRWINLSGVDHTEEDSKRCLDKWTPSTWPQPERNFLDHGDQSRPEEIPKNLTVNGGKLSQRQVHWRRSSSTHHWRSSSYRKRNNAVFFSHRIGKKFIKLLV